MLGDTESVATVAVTSLEKAKPFYQDTLGLTTTMENEEVLAFKTGGSTLFVYRSPYAGSNKATVVTFVSPDVDALVSALKARGVTFEHYDLPHLTRQGDVHVAGAMKTAWFKDPDGNILCLVTPPSASTT